MSKSALDSFRCKYSFLIMISANFSYILVEAGRSSCSCSSSRIKSQYCFRILLSSLTDSECDGVVDVVDILLAVDRQGVSEVSDELIVSEVSDMLTESDVLFWRLGSHGPLIARTVCSTMLLLRFLLPG